MQKNLLIASAILIIIIGLAVSFSSSHAPTEESIATDLGLSFCGEPGIFDVQISNNIVRVVYALGNSVFYYTDGSELQCPHVAPEDISIECNIELKKTGWKSVCENLGTANIDARNTTYTIENELITLADGEYESIIDPESTTTITTKMFGEPVFGDLDHDGDDDAGIFLTVESGGTGTFYYAAAAIYDNGVWLGTNAVLLGDRIAPQTLEIRDFALIANYAVRKPGEPFASSPSIGVSKYMEFLNGKLAEIEQQ